MEATMQILLKYGHSFLSLESVLPAHGVRVLSPGRACPSCDEISLIGSALENPIASPRLAELVSPGQRVVVGTSDVTRPCPSALLLPFMLDELNRGGVCDEDITVVFGRGSHRPHTQE